MDTNLDETVSSKETVRQLNRDHTCNVEGLLSTRKDTDGEIVSCSITEEPLYFVREDGFKVQLATYGVCYNCDAHVHESALATVDGMQKTSYPVTYIGYWCQPCDGLEENEWRSTQEMLAKVEDID
jgi:hypothetical protein